MPGLSGRFSTVVQARISKLLDQAEDPAETLDYSHEEQIELLQNVKKGVEEVVTSKKRLQLQEDGLRAQAVRLDGQARQALAAGEEELARAALQRQQTIESELGSIDQQVAELKAQAQLTANEKRLQDKIEAFRTKKEVVKAQYWAAEARVLIPE